MCDVTYLMRNECFILQSTGLAVKTISQKMSQKVRVF